jgi:hypothetical protein
MGDDLHINKQTYIFIANHRRLLRQNNLIQLKNPIANETWKCADQELEGKSAVSRV